MLVVVVLGAVQMFVLGMIGEYLGRLYIEAKRRPLYIVAEIAGRRRRPAAASAMSLTAEALTDRSPTSDRDAGRERHPADRMALEPEQRFEQAVDRRRRQLVVAVLLAGDPAGEPRGGGERESRLIEPAHAFELAAPPRRSTARSVRCV